MVLRCSFKYHSILNQHSKSLKRPASTAQPICISWPDVRVIKQEVKLSGMITPRIDTSIVGTGNQVELVHLVQLKREKCAY